MRPSNHRVKNRDSPRDPRQPSAAGRRHRNGVRSTDRLRTRTRSRLYLCLGLETGLGCRIGRKLQQQLQNKQWLQKLVFSRADILQGYLIDGSRGSANIAEVRDLVNKCVCIMRGTGSRTSQETDSRSAKTQILINKRSG